MRGSVLLLDNFLIVKGREDQQLRKRDHNERLSSQTLGITSRGLFRIQSNIKDGAF